MLETLKECDVCKGTKIEPIKKNIRIFQCKDCGYVFDNPRPTLKAIQKFYSVPAKYSSWTSNEEGYELLWERRLNMVLKKIKQGVLLDVGAGIGQFLNRAKKHFSVTGTELSKSAIKIAKDKYGVKLIHGDIMDINFHGKKFDVITAFHVLEHVPCPSKFVKKCRTLLKPGGLLIIAVPNDINPLVFLNDPFGEIMVMLGKRKRIKYVKYKLSEINLDEQDEVHLSHFSEKSLKKLLVDNGFVITGITLDPFFQRTGLKLAYRTILYYVFLFIKTVFRVNFYDTILVYCRKG